MVKKEYPGLVNELFQYFTGPINYTLTAYCCKILTSLLNKRTSTVSHYIYSFWPIFLNTRSMHNPSSLILSHDLQPNSSPESSLYKLQITFRKD